MTLQVALLRRTQGLVEQHFCSTHLAGEHFDLVSFSAAYEQRGVGRSALAGNAFDRLHACGLCQQAELFKVMVEIGKTQVDANQNCQWPGAAREIVGTQLAGLSSESAAAKVTARPGTMVEMACLYTI